MDLKRNVEMLLLLLLLQLLLLLLSLLFFMYLFLVLSGITYRRGSNVFQQRGEGR